MQIDDAMIEIKQVEEITPDVVNAFSVLIPQLSPDSDIPTQEYLEQLISISGNYVFVAVAPQIVGSLTLVVMQTPSGAKAWIEDVVVDSTARGLGVGAALVAEAIDFAKRLHVSSINLTSRPDRVSANKLYQRLGFQLRDTNVYRLTIDKD